MKAISLAADSPLCVGVYVMVDETSIIVDCIQEYMRGCWAAVGGGEGRHPPPAKANYLSFAQQEQYKNGLRRIFLFIYYEEKRRNGDETQHQASINCQRKLHAACTISTSQSRQRRLLAACTMNTSSQSST